jgi:hypothetical protein
VSIQADSGLQTQLRLDDQLDAIMQSFSKNARPASLLDDRLSGS